MDGDVTAVDTADGTVVAAGAVIWRPDLAHDGGTICLVHRPRYDDWSLPKASRIPVSTCWRVPCVRSRRRPASESTRAAAPDPALRGERYAETGELLGRPGR
jgi:hypothetical protein